LVTLYLVPGTLQTVSLTRQACPARAAEAFFFFLDKKRSKKSSQQEGFFAARGLYPAKRNAPRLRYVAAG
jgi:hypothetical protein